MEMAVNTMMDNLLAQGRSTEGTQLACQVLAADSRSDFWSVLVEVLFFCTPEYFL